MTINIQLAREHKLSDETIMSINSCHATEKEMIEVMELINDKKSLKEMYLRWTELQFYLQDLWGFDRDSMHHRSWYLPKCICAKMDNDDIYPHGMHGGYWITENCPIHT